MDTLRRRRWTESGWKPFQGFTILVVDDHVDGVTATRALLELYGARVLAASNGLEALRLLQAERPDLILCDLRMPGMDGYEFVARLRQTPKLAALTVLAVTALCEDPAALDVQTAGFDGRLAKPLDGETFLEAIQDALSTDRYTPRMR
jgi:CheY-like chemotaxis protein